MNPFKKLMMMFMVMDDDLDPTDEQEIPEEEYINHYDDLDDLKLMEMEQFYEEEDYPEETETE